MQFTGERHVPASLDAVWSTLHDHEALRVTIPGCERLAPLGSGVYSATLAARVGRLADTYRGTFRIDDTSPGRALRVSVDGRGRFGTLGLDLRVRLAEGPRASTFLSYDARAVVGGMVSRLGRAPLSVAGGHLTGCFFRDLERVVRIRATTSPAVGARAAAAAHGTVCAPRSGM